MQYHLLLARHGHVQRNGTKTSPEMIRGWDDVELSAEGRKEAKDLAARLKDREIKKVYTSPLQRASYTAEQIAIEYDLMPIKLGSLRPWNLGKLQGKPVKDVLDEMMRLQTESPDEPAPEGESWNSFTKRFLARLKDLMNEVKRGKTICAVSHFRNLATARAWFSEGIDNPRIDLDVLDKSAEDISTGDIYCLTYDSETKQWEDEIEKV